MKQLLFFILLIAIVPKGFGQIEFNMKFKAIPPLNTKLKTKKENASDLNLPKIIAPNVFKESNIFGTKPKPNNAFEIGTPENHFSMTPKNKFEHKLGDVYQDKMNQDLHKTLHENDLPLVREDKFFGDFKTKSKYFSVKYRDFIVVDGDLVRAYQNDKVIEYTLEMDGYYKEFRITFQEGFNKIEFEALNTGLSGGNTAEFQIYDDKGQLFNSYFWENLATGFKGKLIIYKE